MKTEDLASKQVKSLTFGELQAYLRTRQKHLENLQARHARLQEKLNTLADQIRQELGRPAGSSGGGSSVSPVDYDTLVKKVNKFLKKNSPAARADICAAADITSQYTFLKAMDLAGAKITGRKGTRRYSYNG